MKKRSRSDSDIPQPVPVIMRRLADEILIYDPKTARAHSLNAVAAKVWQLCDGARSVSEIVRAMSTSQVPVDAEIVRNALSQFASAGLLARPCVDLQRRRILKTGAIAASLAVPIIASVIVPEAEAAVSCSTLGQQCNPRPCCGLLTCVANLCV
jgi:hypothetical protein